MTYIDREKLIQYIDEKGRSLGITEANKCNFKDIIKVQPTADVYEEVHGQWIDTDTFDNFKTPIYQCSVCINEVADNYIHLHKYCLHCGAKMDGERKIKERF